jgi:hypothetical protein
MCVDYVLASPRIAQADPGRRTPPRGGSVTGTKPGPNRAIVGLAGPTSLASRSGVGAFSNFALPTYQGRSVHGVSFA